MKCNVNKILCKVIAILIIIIVFSACATINNKENLMLKEIKLNTQIPLKINGYYYYENEVIDYLVKNPNTSGGVTPDYKTEYNRKTINIMVFYKNGYVYNSDMLLICGEIPNEITDIEQISQYNTYEKAKREYEQSPNSYCYGFTGGKRDIWNWGVFKIENQKIKIQYYRNILGDYFLVEMVGSIINDTTFLISNEKLYGNMYINGYQKEINKKYYFSELSNKPDSANYILKNPDKFINN